MVIAEIHGSKCISVKHDFILISIASDRGFRESGIWLVSGSAAYPCRIDLGKDSVMSAPLQAVFFDVDGVLIDSLPQHLQICRDKANEYGLSLQIPSIEQFRDQIRRGVKVSPMLNFFMAVGFPKAYATRAVNDYQKDFADKYHPPAFPDIDQMLRTLSGNGLRLGLVTSNIRANVVPALGSAMRHFEESCLFFFDPNSKEQTKSWCLIEGARILGVNRQACAYVGDLPADAIAAQEAGVQFFGVTYGWGIAGSDGKFVTADTVTEIPSKLAHLAGTASDNIKALKALA
ncbi:MAG: HAD family hydrolase [Methylovirgula sp.]